jgi:hypothetical protein
MPARRAGAVSEAVRVVGVLLVLGLLCGALWSLVVTPAEFTKLANGGSMDEDQLARQFGADAWYVVIGAPAGLAAGIALSWRRSRDPVSTSGWLVVGSVVAAVVMALTGHLLGPGDPQAALVAAKVGAHVPESLRVGTLPVWPLTDYLRDTMSIYLAWPVGVLAGALCGLLSRTPDDETQDADPAGLEVAEPDISPRSAG